jgi:O-antigen/teichoic acid export membrane protein
MAKLRAIWNSNSFWALGDQAILSAGNFLTNLTIYREFSDRKAEAGKYYIVLSFILFLNNLHMSLVTYPLSITAGACGERDFRRRTRRAVEFTLLGSILFSAVIILPTARIGGWALVPWVVAALILWQLQETLRRAMMARLEYRRAMPGDIISYLGQAILVWAFIRHDTPISWAFGIIGITSAAAIVVQFIQLRGHQPVVLAPEDPVWAEQAAEHWNFGKWLMLSNLTGILSVYATPWVIGYFQGTGGAAMYSAVILLLNASNPVLASVAGLITPAVAKSKAEQGMVAARRIAKKYATEGGALLVPFYGILLLIPGFMLKKFYKANSPYIVLTSQMRVFVLIYACTYLSAMISSFLCGLGKSRLPFFGQAANAVCTVLITLPLAARYGVTGAAWGGLIPIMAQLTVNLYFLRSVRDTEAVVPVAEGFPVIRH